MLRHREPEVGVGGPCVYVVEGDVLEGRAVGNVAEAEDGAGDLAAGVGDSGEESHIVLHMTEAVVVCVRGAEVHVEGNDLGLAVNDASEVL